MIGVSNHGIAMGDDQRGSLTAHGGESRLDFRLGGVIDVGGCFVQDENARLRRQGTGELDSLAFAHGETHPTFADLGAQPVGQTLHGLT